MPPLSSNATQWERGPCNVRAPDFSRAARYVDFYMDSSNHEVFSQIQIDNSTHILSKIPRSKEVIKHGQGNVKRTQMSPE